MTDSEEKI